jgi:hypothetical protein
MGRWTNLATWRGPTRNSGDGDSRLTEAADQMREHRGLVIHIAEGYNEGTISHELNPLSHVSSHFVVGDGAKNQGRDGVIEQIVDTDIAAWTQRAGNGRWLSVECAGFTPHALTAAQCESVAQLFARTHREYGVPLQIATSPSGRGLGHHSMGHHPGFPDDWGHGDCPGPAIIAQKPAILARAIDIVNGKEPDDMADPIDVWRYRGYRAPADAAHPDAWAIFLDMAAQTKSQGLVLTAINAALTAGSGNPDTAPVIKAIAGLHDQLAALAAENTALREKLAAALDPTP